MKLLTWSLLATVAAAQGPLQVPFKSRADLVPASLNVTVNQKGKVSDQHIFTAPWVPSNIKGIPSNIGPHIFDSQGELVWSGFGSIPNVVANFMPITYQGEQMMSFFDGVPGKNGIGIGTYSIMNNKYQRVKHLGLKSQHLGDFHEFLPTGNSAVHTAYVAVPHDLSGYDSPLDLSDGWVYTCKIVDIDLETDEVLFSWDSLEHISLSHSKTMDDMKSSGNSSMNAFDYLHVNSVEKDEQGNYLISARHSWTLYYIDGKTGQIIWSINNGNAEESSWDVDEDAAFGFQHDARWVEPSKLNMPDEPNVKYISLFDNDGKDGHDDPDVIAFRNYSRGLIIKLEEYEDKKDGKIGTVSLFKEYTMENPLKPSFSQGSIQLLDNGNVFIGWGADGEISEHDFETGETLFRAVINNNEYASYRAFKASFKGYPIGVPSIASHVSDSTTTTYISWNGATEVTGYNIFASEDGENYFKIDQIKKTGFEDVVEADKIYKWVKVEATSGNGTVIGTSSSKSTIIKA